MEVKTDQSWIFLTRSVLGESDAREYLRVSESGGICLFAGTTRGITKAAGRQDGAGAVKTTRLEYDCYPEMAVAEMQRLVATAIEKWDVRRVTMFHRLGPVPVAESSVLIGVSSPHRNDAFIACRYLIDSLKESVPIWKKEYFEDGTTEWVGVPGIDDALDNVSQT